MSQLSGINGKQNNELIRWLDKKINNDLSKFAKNKYGNFFMGKYEYASYNNYYDENDIDVLMNNDEIAISTIQTTDKKTNLDPEVIEIYNSCEIYDNKIVVIPRNTNRAHVNYLYKRLIDVCNLNNMNLMMCEKDEIIEMPIFSKDMKDSFYEFCQKYST
jgi:hypothetical protein